jgi:hypothetical protein
LSSFGGSAGGVGGGVEPRPGPASAGLGSTGLGSGLGSTGFGSGGFTREPGPAPFAGGVAPASLASFASLVVPLDSVVFASPLWLSAARRRASAGPAGRRLSRPRARGGSSSGAARRSPRA